MLTARPLQAMGRRRFLGDAATLGVAALAGLPRRSAAEAPPETRRIRFLHAPALCLAPQYMAEDLLRLEGFTNIEYVDMGTQHGPNVIAAGGADISMWDTPGTIPALESGKAIVLGGVHAGCIEVFGNDRIKALRDIKGKRVAIVDYGNSDHVFLSSLAAYIGIDPRTDIDWVRVGVRGDAIQAFSEGKADALMAFVPQPQELRARRIGHVVLDTVQDRPWSQYFCCSVHANREFVAKNPIATKRVLRAILKSADLCARDPQTAAAYMVAKGYETRPAIALEVVSGLPYRRWRDSDPEDTVRFYALRLHEVGMIKTPPHKLVAQGTDLRFFRELTRELKA
jgi:NitT/TauT family transport system substrate-binding protein